MIRTGLDLGFDGGAAAWALELTGCVVTARTEADAIRLLPARVDDFARWLQAAGERVDVPPAEGVEIVERVPTERLVDGYEVNATFEDDRRPVGSEEADAALRWLGLARSRLQRAITGAATKPLSGDGRDREQLVDHVIRAERWLATRVEPDQRSIAFPTGDGAPICEQLDRNAEFVAHHVRRAATGDGVHLRVDSKGEAWTARKILRRLIYHALDHAEELERRAGATVAGSVR